RRHTRFDCDWSSDVCSSDLSALPEELFESLKHLTQESSLIVRGKIRAEARAPGGFEMDLESADIVQRVPESDPYPITPKEHGIRSEERRVGKECRSRGSAGQ